MSLYPLHTSTRDISQVIAAESSPLRIAGSRTRTGKGMVGFLAQVAKH